MFFFLTAQSDAISLPGSEVSLGPWDDEVRLVLLGKTGVGKSETGSGILNEREAFKFDSTFCSVTKSCSRKSAPRYGTVFHVTDTPGIIDRKSGTLNIRAPIEVLKCLELNKPGPHVFLFVLRADVRFTNEEVEALNNVEKYFGEEIFRYMIIVFTRGDALENSFRTIDDMLGEMPEEFVRLYERCAGRCVTIENPGSTSSWDYAKKNRKRQSQLRDLFNCIRQLLAENNWSFFSANKMNSVTVEE